MLASPHPLGREVRVESRKRGVVSYLGEQPHIAQPGKEEVEMCAAPAALQVPGPHAHILIMARAATGGRTTTQKCLFGARNDDAAVVTRAVA